MKPKFSSFFKNVVVELDKEMYGPDNHLTEWHRSPSSEETDGFTVSAIHTSLSYFLSSLLPLAFLPFPFLSSLLSLLPLLSLSLFVSPQVTRPGEETVKCTILLLLNHQVSLARPSPAHAAIATLQYMSSVTPPTPPPPPSISLCSTS